MKKIFRLSQQPQRRETLSESSESRSITPMSFAIPPQAQAGLQAKFTVPAVPHPHPYELIAVLDTSEGLLLRPVVGNFERVPVLHVSWGTDYVVRELPSSDSGDIVKDSFEWDDAAVVYGVVGVLTLHACRVRRFCARITRLIPTSCSFVSPLDHGKKRCRPLWVFTCHLWA